MMNTRLQTRAREYLETLMAEIRPLPSERSHLDFSYRLSDDAFVLQKHVRTLNTDMLVAQPVLKVVHAEDPEGWLLYQQDADGHWQPHAEMVFATDLTDVMASARLSAGFPEVAAPIAWVI